jgi:hypothetical protein
MCVSFHHHGAEPPLEQMAFVVVPPVEPLGIDAVEPMHSPRKVSVWGVDEQVIVVRH